MGKLGKMVSKLLGDNVLRVLLVVVLGLAAYMMGSDVFGRKYMSSYEMVKDLPPYSLSENNKQSEDQTLPAVIRLHTGKPTEMEKLKSMVGLGSVQEEGQFFCSAFVVSDKYAITAGHCLEGEDGINKKDIEIFISSQSEGMVTPTARDTSVTAKAVGINRLGDTGLLIGDFSKFRKVKFTPFAKDLLDIIRIAMMNNGQLISVGFPYGAAPFVTPVQFVGVHEFQLYGRAFLYPGQSGGPLIEPNTGYAIGINSSVDGSGGCNFSSLIGFLDSLKVEVVE
jgi:S1-C subfamily serine protease